jgi:hypothetical protein
MNFNLKMGEMFFKKKNNYFGVTCTSNSNLDSEIFLQLKTLNEKNKTTIFFFFSFSHTPQQHNWVDGWHSISFNHSIPIDNNKHNPG